MHYVRGYVLQLLKPSRAASTAGTNEVRDVGTQGLVTDRDVGCMVEVGGGWEAGSLLLTRTHTSHATQNFLQSWQYR